MARKSFKRLLGLVFSGVLGASSSQDLPSQNDSLERVNYSQDSIQNVSALAQVDRVTRIHRILDSNGELDFNDFNFLFNNIMPEIERISEANLTQQQKDLRMFANRLRPKIAVARLSQSVSDIISNNPNGFDYTDFVRNKASSLYMSQGVLTVDYTQINSSLASNIEKYSRQEDINPRLVAVICTIENNFGLETISSQGAMGMCQTLPGLVRSYYSNYDSMSEGEKNWAHFMTTFYYIRDLKKEYNLSIGYHDDPYVNKVDFIRAAYLYHQGETEVSRNWGEVREGTNGYNYILKVIGSYQFPNMILVRND